nr:LysR substrate-binding domain-containing protein [Bradyrhizobium macuxiense]
MVVREEQHDDADSVEGRARIAGNEGAITAAVTGLGIVMPSSGSLRPEFEEGKLIRVPPNWDLGTVELSAVYAAGRTIKRAACALTDFMIEALKTI